MEQIGELIRKYRKLKKMTLKKLALQINITDKHLSNIELGKKGISKKTLSKIQEILSISDYEIFELQKNKKNTRPNSVELLNKREIEIINTYDYIRENSNEFSKRASVNRILIDMTTKLEESMFGLELALSDVDIEVLKKIRNPIVNTMKSLQNKIDRLNTISKKGELKKMDISNLVGQIPISNFTKEQIRVAILTWVAKDLRFRLKDYNVNGLPSGVSRRLWEAGRGTKGNKGYMENKIDAHLAKNIDFEKSIEEISEEISQNIVEDSIIIMEDFLKAARNAKTQAVRSKYLKAMGDREFLVSTFHLSIFIYCKELINNGYNIEHEYLTVRLNSLDVNKSKLNKIWIDYAEGNITLEEAHANSEAIMQEYETLNVITTDQLDKITNEKLLYQLLGEPQLLNHVYNTIDEMAQALQGKVRLMEASEFNGYGYIDK